MLQRPPHPTFQFGHLLPAAKGKRLSSLPRARQLQFFFNARSALFHIFRGLRAGGRRRVLLPAFHCTSVVEPALQAGMQVSFYRIDRRLEIDFDDLRSLAGNDVAAVVLINYFGFPARLDPILAELRTRGIVAIEDCSHSFVLEDPLALTGGRTDFSVYSFWKLVPSGVGGGLLSAMPFPTPAMEAPTLVDTLVWTKRMFEEAVLASDSRSLLGTLYARAEAARVRRRKARAAHAEAATTGDPALEFDERRASTRLPRLARHIVGAADLQAVVTSRRSNYLAYSHRFADVELPLSVLPPLAPRVCPWAFPVIVPERSRHDQNLRRRGVPVWTFGNVLHPALDGAVSPATNDDARFLADNLLCLPVHQGITERQADAFAVEILEYFRAIADDAR